MVEEPVKTKFVVLIDTAEDLPFEFAGLRADADKDYRPLVVQKRRQCLGRHPDSLGDYSVEGYEQLIGIERKSMEDAQGTVLGWPSPSDLEHGRVGRRQRFERELQNLSRIPYGIVIVEANLSECVERMPSWGSKSAEENKKIFHRTVLSYMRRFTVPWLFCGDRRHAEKAAYSWLMQCWRDARRSNVGIQEEAARPEAGH